jgi:hypothetical protein
MLMRRLPRKIEAELYAKGDLGADYLDRYYGVHQPFGPIIQQVSHCQHDFRPAGGDPRSASQVDWTPDMPSRGLGDTVAKLTHATGIDRLAKAYTRMTGRDCGCDKRQVKLNRIKPYGR